VKRKRGTVYLVEGPDLLGNSTLHVDDQTFVLPQSVVKRMIELRQAAENLFEDATPSPKLRRLQEAVQFLQPVALPMGRKK
jgi:hypothetical protein